MKFVNLLAFGLLSYSAIAGAANDFIRIECSDDVSFGDIYIKMKHEGARSMASIKIVEREGTRIYQPSQVRIRKDNTYEKSVRFELYQNGQKREEVAVSVDTIKFGHGLGYYADRGDSRSIICERK